MNGDILAIDFGGTRIRAARFAPDLTLLARAEQLTQVSDGQDAVMDRIRSTARQVVPAGMAIAAIGISGPGPLDAQRGVIRHARTLPGWREVPLAAMISADFDAPAYLQNDASLAALAEYYRGTAQGCDPLIYLTISTGIGGGAVINGRLFTGWHGLAIEPGHQYFTLPDGSIRRLEELASGTALGDIATERLRQAASPSILRTAAAVDGRAVGQAAVSGDALALEVVREAGVWLGLGLVNILHLFNPQAVVLGGSVAQLGDLLLAPARRIIAEYTLDPGFDDPHLLRVTTLGDDVCLTGAALHALVSIGVML